MISEAVFISIILCRKLSSLLTFVDSSRQKTNFRFPLSTDFSYDTKTLRGEICMYQEPCVTSSTYCNLKKNHFRRE